MLTKRQRAVADRALTSAKEATDQLSQNDSRLLLLVWCLIMSGTHNKLQYPAVMLSPMNSIRCGGCSGSVGSNTVGRTSTDTERPFLSMVIVDERSNAHKVT